MSPRHIWRVVVGTKGNKVSAIERTPGRFYLRYWLRGTGGERGKWKLEAIPAKTRTTAEAQALAMSQALVLAEPAETDGPITVGALLTRYSDDMSAHKKGAQPSEDARRAAVWLAFLGASREARKVGKNDLARFVRDRRANKIRAKMWRTVKGEQKLVPVKLKPNPSDTTIGADVIYLQAVWNWAVREELLDRSRITNYTDRPASKNPKQPVATVERYVALREHCDAADPRFGAFFDCVMWLGWRVSGVCAIRACDVHRTPHEHYPHGQIWKNPKADKEGVEMLLPMPKAVREAVDRIPAIGDAPLFPAPKDRTRGWSRWHARDLLERAEKLAGLDPIPGGDFHPYRRLWATLRKHLPDADVMAAGGWRDPRSLKKAYQHTDPETLRDVVLLDPTAPKDATPTPTKKPADEQAG